jgi:hypothetical protein
MPRKITPKYVTCVVCGRIYRFDKHGWDKICVNRHCMEIECDGHCDNAIYYKHGSKRCGLCLYDAKIRDEPANKLNRLVEHRRLSDTDNIEEPIYSGHLNRVIDNNNEFDDNLNEISNSDNEFDEISGEDNDNDSFKLLSHKDTSDDYDKPQPVSYKPDKPKINNNGSAIINKEGSLFFQVNREYNQILIDKTDVEEFRKDGYHEWKGYEKKSVIRVRIKHEYKQLPGTNHIIKFIKPVIRPKKCKVSPISSIHNGLCDINAYQNLANNKYRINDIKGNLKCFTFVKIPKIVKDTIPHRDPIADWRPWIYIGTPLPNPPHLVGAVLRKPNLKYETYPDVAKKPNYNKRSLSPYGWVGDGLKYKKLGKPTIITTTTIVFSPKCWRSIYKDGCGIYKLSKRKSSKITNRWGYNHSYHHECINDEPDHWGKNSTEIYDNEKTRVFGVKSKKWYYAGVFKKSRFSKSYYSIPQTYRPRDGKNSIPGKNTDVISRRTKKDLEKVGIVWKPFEYANIVWGDAEPVDTRLPVINSKDSLKMKTGKIGIFNNFEGSSDERGTGKIVPLFNKLHKNRNYYEHKPFYIPQFNIFVPAIDKHSSFNTSGHGSKKKLDCPLINQKEDGIILLL